MARGGIPIITRDLAFAAGATAADMHMNPHTLKPWDQDACDKMVRTTNRLLMHVPMEKGGLKGMPLTQKQREELGVE